MYRFVYNRSCRVRYTTPNYCKPHSSQLASQTLSGVWASREHTQANWSPWRKNTLRCPLPSYTLPCAHHYQTVHMCQEIQACTINNNYFTLSFPVSLYVHPDSQSVRTITSPPATSKHTTLLAVGCPTVEPLESEVGSQEGMWATLTECLEVLYIIASYFINKPLFTFWEG